MAKKHRRKNEFKFPSKLAEDLYDEWEENDRLADEHSDMAMAAKKKYAEECGKQAGLKPGDYIAGIKYHSQELPFVVIGFTDSDYGHDERIWGIRCHLVKSDGTPNRGHADVTINAFDRDGEERWRKIDKSEVRKLLDAAK